MKRTLTKSATAPAATAGKPEKKPRQKLSIINPRKSAFTSSTLPFVSQDEGNVNCDSGREGKTLKAQPKKRPVIESDGDSDLDFCEESPFKKSKKSAPLNSRKKKSEECILLDSDSDDENSQIIDYSRNKAKLTDGQKNTVKGQSAIRENSKHSKFTENPSEFLPLEVPNGIIDSDGDE